MTTIRGLTRQGRRKIWEESRIKPCQCRSCTELKYTHIDFHLKKHRPSPHCYQCRIDFAEELATLTTITNEDNK